MSDEPRQGSGRDESEEERADRQLAELLQELRVAQAGVQILFAFLLVIPFQDAFDSISHGMKLVHAAALISALAAAALLTGPVALHRVTFRQHMKPEIILYAHRLALGGLAFLALSMSASVLLALDVSLGLPIALTTFVVAVVGFSGLWFIWPSYLRIHASRDPAS